jgi:hypothetical protein
MQYRVYNTGDQIWLSQRYGKEVTVKLITHDGIYWDEETNAPPTKLTGLEAAMHKVQVFCIKLILKVLS